MSRVNAAESLRGLACLAVVFSHHVLTFFPFLHINSVKFSTSGSKIIDWIYNSPFGFIYSGTSAVFLFFVLSGYVLSYSILSKKDVTTKLLSMSLKRYPRLAIPVLVACIFSYGSTRIQIDTSLVSDWFSSYNLIHPTFIETIYEGLIGSFMFGHSNINWVLWTMQIELLASFVLFLLLYIYHSIPNFFVPASIIIPMIFFFISPMAVVGAYSFIFGAYLYIYGKQLPNKLSIFLIIVGLYFAGVHLGSYSYTPFSLLFKSFSYYLLNFFAGILIVTGVLMNKKISDILDKKLLVSIGGLSFSIYLLHFPLIYIVAVPVFNLMIKLSDNYILSVFLATSIHIALTLITSIFFRKYIDNSAITIANKIEVLIIKKGGSGLKSMLK